MNKNLWLRRIRNICGFLGAMLPWISLLGTYIACNNGQTIDWSKLSISATYYYTPALVAILTAASIVLMCYDGYDLKDNILTTLAGVFGICIVLFPCSGYGDYVGFFRINSFVSNIIHSVSAVGFFGLLAYINLFLFTLNNGEMTPQKKKRNIVYRVCGIGMIVSFAIMVIPNLFAKAFITEAISLTFFGVAWLIKGNVFGLMKDKS